MHLPAQCNSLPIALGQGAVSARMALPFKSRAEHQNKKTTIQVIFLIWRAVTLAVWNYFITESSSKPQYVVGQKFRSMQSESLGLNQ